MERICEFCAALRPIVFCKADSAFLCLSCDAKVHSANALSNRHFRCLVCESCRGQPAHIRCLDHRMLLCRACDGSLHGNNVKVNRHQRRMVSSFTGSPSAKQFAILWGFDANQLPLEEQLAGPSTLSIFAGSSHPERTCAISSTYKPNEMSGKNEQQPCLLMQQILELNRLQLNEGNNPSAAIRERGQAHSSSPCVYNTLGRINEGLEDTMMRDSSGQMDDLHALKEDHFLPPPLTHLEYLSSYTSTAGISLVGEPFWQSRTALESSQFWAQNLEEPRVSEELDGLDVFKMPEVDMTFRNFEELLLGDQDLSRALLEDDSTAFFCPGKDPIADRSKNSDARSAQPTDNTAPSSMYTQFPHQDCQKPKKTEPATKIRPSYSYSYSFSHLSAESSGSDCYDSGHSGDLARADPTLNPSQLEGANNGSSRFKDKKKSRLNAKQIQLAPRKSKAEPNRRLTGRPAKPEDEENHHMKATRSC